MGTITTSYGYSKKLLNLAKIYIDDIKYCGCNDIFRLKLVNFHNICLKADILLKAKIKSFFTILEDLAFNHYYSNIYINTVAMNFNQIYNSIKNYFKKAKYK